MLRPSKMPGMEEQTNTNLSLKVFKTLFAGNLLKNAIKPALEKS